MADRPVPPAAATRLAVLGSPIAHSLSPRIHRAAYQSLGLDWQYEPVQLLGTELAEWVSRLDQDWRGLSLTMPLKREVLPLLAWRHPLVDVVGAANTVLMTDRGPAGFNTDVYGIVAALAHAGVSNVDRVHLLGAGATASSALVAVAQLGASSISVEARSVGKARELVALGERLGVVVAVSKLGVDSTAQTGVELVVSTLPGAADGVPSFGLPVRGSAVLFDVAYSPWPSTLARDWLEANGRVVSGLEMLLHQAVGQIRVFVAGDPDEPLDRERSMLDAMRAAVA